MSDLFYWGLIGLLVGVSVFRIDAWPFFYYPMFSKYRTTRDMAPYCLYLEKEGGEQIRWEPRFYYLQHDFNRRFRFAQNLSADKREQQEVLLFKRCLSGTKSDHFDMSQVVALHVYQKEIVDNEHGGFSTQQQSILRIPTSQLKEKRGKRRKSDG